MAFGTNTVLIDYAASVADPPEPASVGPLGLALIGTAAVVRSRRRPE
jgi:MYXO-CTERM domain-containing protein